MPVMVSVKTNGVKMKNVKKAPIDLICVIDRSGSMQGEKITLVKQSLKQLLKLLSEESRLCLIDFSTGSSVLTPFLRIQEKNHDTIMDQIIQLQASGGTDTTSGMTNAFRMLLNRKYKNPVSCIFLLSDGCDDRKGAEKRIGNVMSQFAIQDNFSVNTFGYGSDHDPDTMRGIAQLKEGNFYFIEDFNKVDEYFILSMSGLLTVIAQKVKLHVKLQPEHEHIFKAAQLKIAKTYGGQLIWNYDEERKEYVISLNYLLGGVSKDYFLEIQVPAQRKQLQDHEKSACVIKGTLTAESVFDQSLIFREQQLLVNFANFDEKVKELEEREDFEINYFRVRSAETIGEAATLANQAKYEDAKALLLSLIKDLKGSKYAEDNVLKVIIKDCEKSMEFCNPRVFEERGKAFMYKKEQNHINRVSSACDLLYANDCEEDLLHEIQMEKMNSKDSN